MGATKKTKLGANRARTEQNKGWWSMWLFYHIVLRNASVAEVSNDALDKT